MRFIITWCGAGFSFIVQVFDLKKSGVHWLCMLVIKVFAWCIGVHWRILVDFLSFVLSFFTLSVWMELWKISPTCYLCKLVSVYSVKLRWSKSWEQTQTKFTIFRATLILCLSLQQFSGLWKTHAKWWMLAKIFLYT